MFSCLTAFRAPARSELLRLSFPASNIYQPRMLRHRKRRTWAESINSAPSRSTTICVWQLSSLLRAAAESSGRNEIGLLFLPLRPHIQRLGNLFSYDISHKLMEKRLWTGEKYRSTLAGLSPARGAWGNSQTRKLTRSWEKLLEVSRLLFLRRSCYQLHKALCFDVFTASQMAWGMRSRSVPADEISSN